MIINYKKYKVYLFTDKQLKKKYTKNILDKYYYQLAFLYQNGYDLDCNSFSDIEEQFNMWNNLETYEDFEDFESILGVNFSDETEIGKKIFIEELYDILKESSFCRNEVNDPVSIKTYAKTYWKKIENILNRIEELFYSSDSEIKKVYSKLENLNDIREKLDFIYEKIESELKVITWIKFVEFNSIIYSTYIKLSKVKTDTINVSKASNLNDELYGSIGGFNPNNGEIKSIIGSAVWEVKTVKNTKSAIKIKTLANSILNDTIKTKEDDDNIKYLERWYNGKEHDDEKARQVVVNSLLFGVLSLLCLKHNLNFLDDKRNSLRADAIKSEFIKILEYCEIEKDYLL